jgi:iron complex transport system permease protein
MAASDVDLRRPQSLPPGWTAAAVLLLLVAVAVGLAIGPARLPVTGVVDAIASALPGVGAGVTGSEQLLDERQLTILWRLRLPRVALGALVGGTLATAGAAYQGVFRNPLADPYFLGVSAGAGLGATLVVTGGHTPLGASSLPLFAFVGASLAVVLTWVLGRSVGGRGTATIILAGVAVSLFLGAVQTFLQQRSDDQGLRSVYGFILGQLNTSGWDDVAVAAPFALVAVGGIMAGRRLLDVLAVGDVEATALGLSANRVRLVLVALATLGTAAVVSVSGLIGFVGIVVPHTVRLVAGSSYRSLVPLSFVVGAAFLVGADVVARSALAPAEVPIGVVTAFLGAPFFLLILRTSRRTLL